MRKEGVMGERFDVRRHWSFAMLVLVVDVFESEVLGGRDGGDWDTK